MVHFYHEISDHELFEICTCQLSDIPETATIIKDWTHRHQEIMDEKPGRYRLLDGAHRWSAYKTVGMMELRPS